MRNYQLYGEVVKIDMEEKSQYEKEKVVEVASVD